jgi:ketosteroid isomerase-like protein
MPLLSTVLEAGLQHPTGLQQECVTMHVAQDLAPSQATDSSVAAQRSVPSWVIQMFAAIDAFDVDTFLGFLSPRCEFRFGNAPTLTGHDAVRQVVSGIFSAIKGIRHQELEAWVDADTTICRGTVTYIRHNDTELTVPFAVIFRLEEGLVRHQQIFIDQSLLFAEA